MPTVEVMKGQMMYSPEPTPSPARITLGPSTLLRRQRLRHVAIRHRRQIAVADRIEIFRSFCCWQLES